MKFKMEGAYAPMFQNTNKRIQLVNSKWHKTIIKWTMTEYYKETRLLSSSYLMTLSILIFLTLYTQNFNQIFVR
jgi:hypothetical protein